MRKVLILVFVIVLMLIITGCNKDSNSEDCCECKDCPECDVCCPCDYPYLNK